MTGNGGEIVFLLGETPVRVAGLDPNTTLLDYLRGPAGRCGTKEGCAEGDCGACTVVLGELVEGRLRHRAVNACIQLLPLVHGRQVLTVEDLAVTDDALHPVQRALVEQHGSQCGFCTPGFVMSLYALCQAGEQPDGAGLEDALAGNLCRCTGYGPILAAGRAALAEAEPAGEEPPAGLVALHADAQPLTYAAAGRRYDAPRSLEELSALLAENPEATLIAGLTDVGLWVTKQGRRLDHIVYLGEIAALKRIEETAGWLEIGAGVTYHEAHPVLARHWPDFGELLRRLGSRQIRNAGTIGGNIANGSPIGDSPPPLIALGARLVLNGAAGRREMALEDFFLAYGRQDRQAGEFVEAVRLPLPEPAQHFACAKIAKRFDQDISALCGALAFSLEDNRVADVRIAYGGMAGVPARAPKAEAALAGQPWTEPSVRQAMAALGEDFAPMTDHRASADYRMRAARNLLYRFFLETTGQVTETRVFAHRDAAHG